MVFDNRQAAKAYVPQDGDTLQAIAERESATGNPLTWQELARYNWGTDDLDEIETHMRDQLGCRKRNAHNRFIISTDDQPSNKLLIPVRFRQAGLSVNKFYTLWVRRKQCPTQFLGCCSIPGVTFAYDSSFVRPAVVEHLKALEALLHQHPEGKILIFAHTDLVGDELYNKKLSERRAWSVHAFVTNDVEAWETLYQYENWGMEVIQEILADLGYDPGSIDGERGSKTSAAMRSFLALPEGTPISNDASFRKRLFASYMTSKHDIDLPRERFMDPGYMGCGEFNPVEKAGGECEANRRVTFYLFHPARLPKLPCAFADVGPCQRQRVSPDLRFQASFGCSFYDSLSERCACKERPSYAIRIRLFDNLSRAIAFAPCRLNESISPVIEADGKGYAEFEVDELPPTCIVEWGFPDPDTSLESIGTFPYRRVIHLDVTECEAETAIKRRLHNLGYRIDFDRPLAEQCEVIKRFQRKEMGLEGPGQLDDATIARIKEVHDTCEPVPQSLSSSPSPAS